MLEIQGLSAGYEKRAVLQDIDVVLAPGQLLGIVGPNGSGKSTLLKAAAGLIRPLKGRVLYDGRDSRALSPRARARLAAYLPQFRSIPDLTVGALAAHGRYPHLGMRRGLSPADRAQVDAALDQAGACSFRNRLLSQLSGGERQRAYLAMLLAQDAPCLLLDEPTTALDPAGQLEWMDLLRSLTQAGKGVAVVLHDLPLALSGCDTLLALQAGRVAARGTPEALFQAGALEALFGVRLLRAQTGCYFIAGRL